MGVHLQRAIALLNQSRNEMAEQELMQELAQEPNNAMAHSLLGMCLADRQQFARATEEAQLAIHLAPDDAFGHYALARVMVARNRWKEAAAAIEEAIRLNPYDSSSFGVLAAIRMGQRNWQAALEAAEEGLAVDPEDVRCTNLRAMALVNLGRREQAGQTIDAALARDPDDPDTHANQGWTLLHSGQHVKAMEHFREALRLDPTSEWARQGIVEALKSRHLIYRLMLSYFLWMSRLSGRTQWMIILGGYFGYQVLRSVARNNPEIAPVVWPLLGAYIVFVLMTWLARPLFDLLLRFNRFGRLALSREQIITSNLVGGCLILSIGCVAAFFATGVWDILLLALMCLMLAMPSSVIFVCQPGWPRRWMAAYTALLALLLAVMIAGEAMSTLLAIQFQWLIGLWMTYAIGIFASQFVANALAQVSPRR